MQNTKLYIRHICDCTQCPEYKVLIDIPWKMIIEQKTFDFPVGYCNRLERIIYDFTDIPSDCPLKKSVEEMSKS